MNELKIELNELIEMMNKTENRDNPVIISGTNS